MKSIGIYKNADYKDEVGSIVKGSIDMVITDPPYWHVQGGMSSKKLNVGKFKKDSFLQKKLVMFKKKEIYELLNTLESNKCIFKRDELRAVFFCSKLQIPVYIKWCEENGYKASISIWDREINRMYSSKFYSSNIDYIINIQKSYTDAKIYKYKQKTVLHDTEKPVLLMEDIIKVNLGEENLNNKMVLDLFAGVGTAIKACNNLGVKSIGYEIEDFIYKIGKENINGDEVDV